ncbi:hypothetical protein [Actinomyces mediterranea]|nr:hypothetical protein [Actinomyces mediterranea]
MKAPSVKLNDDAVENHQIHFTDSGNNDSDSTADPRILELHARARLED